VTKPRSGRPGSISGRDRGGIYLVAAASRPALGPTYPPIQWASVAISPGVSRQGCKDDHLHLVLRLRVRGAIPPFPQYSSWRSA